MRPLLACLPISALAVMLSANASAQTTLDGRVNRLEQEMRAVQRKVFPEGAGRLVQPELSAPQTSAAPVGDPATSPVADLEARVSAIEAQLRSLTGQVEQGNFKLRQLEDAFTKFKADAQAQGAAVPAPAVVTPPAKPASLTAKTAAVAGKPGTGASLPDARKMAVAAIEKPETGNDADDAYTYGYRLWAAKFYPEAQVQLKAAVDQYGNTSIASRAQNLLGRAYLDDGKPALASVAFYENYKKRPKGDRAAESLAYLGDALIRIKKLPDACKVYEELGDVYGASLNASLRDMMEKGKLRAKCSV
jgi:TolA-binding protein